MRRVSFFLIEALRSIRGNLAISTAATVTVLIAVFILGAFIPSFLYVQSAVDAQKRKVDIRAFIDDSATVTQIEDFRRTLTEDPRIETATYVSKEEAIRRFQGEFKDPGIFQELPSNFLPAEFEIKPRNAHQAEAIVTDIAKHPAVDQGRDGIVFNKQITDKLLSFARFVQWAGLVLISVLLVASVLLIGNTIRLSIFARRREVEVMKLVGATNWFIRWPFVIEGVICGIIGAAASVVLLWAAKLALSEWLTTGDTALTRNEASTIGFAWLGVILICAGAVVGALGSGITLRRFLRV